MDVPIRKNRDTPRSASSCSTIVAIGDPMPKADTVTLRSRNLPVTDRNPRVTG